MTSFNSNEDQFLVNLYFSKQFADTSFEIGPEKVVFVAHRLVLLASSHKFQEILAASETGVPIPFPDIEPILFEQVLKLIYLNSLELHDAKTAFFYRGIFLRFGLSKGVDLCERYLKDASNINVGNSIFMYETCTGVPEVQEACLKVFSGNTRDILQSKEFLQAQFATVKTIFRLPRLQIESELELLTALFGLYKVHNAEIAAILDLLTEIRFLTLTPGELLNSEAVRTLLTNEQLIALLANVNIMRHPFYQMPEGFSECRENRAEMRNVTETISPEMQTLLDENKAQREEIERLSKNLEIVKNDLQKENRNKLLLKDAKERVLSLNVSKKKIQEEKRVLEKHLKIELALKKVANSKLNVVNAIKKGLVQELQGLKMKVEKVNGLYVKQEKIQLQSKAKMDNDVIFVPPPPTITIIVSDDENNLAYSEHAITVAAIQKNATVDPLAK